MAKRELTVLEQIEADERGEDARALVSPDRTAVAPVVARYARISDDQEDEETGDRGAGVNRQLRLVDSLIAAKGWEASEIDYCDNDLSAFKDSVVRPGFERMLEDLSAGVIEGIVCYDLDRFVRRPDDLERAIKIYDRSQKNNHPLLFASAQGDINLGTNDGIAMARVLVAFANKASRDTGRRVALKHAENRDKKKLVGGRRPFGWVWVWEESVDRNGNIVRIRAGHELVQAEADLIRTEAARIIETGQSNWRRIAERWNAAGVETVMSGTMRKAKQEDGTTALVPTRSLWTQQTVRKVMTSPRLAGWMVHREKIATHSQTGKALRGDFPPILDDEAYKALLRVTGSGPSGKRLGGSHDSVRKYLLAGLVRCGTCGATMDANVRQDRSGDGSARHYYVCRSTGRTTPDGKQACGSNSVAGIRLDALISKLVLPRVIEASRTTRSLDLPNTERLAVIARERSDLAKELDEGVVGSDLLMPKIRRLEREAADLRAEQERWLEAQGVRRLSVGLSESKFDALPIPDRRALIASQLLSISVARVTRPAGSGFDPSRVTPVWR